MSNFNNNKTNYKNDALLSYNKINQTGEISPFENDEIQNFRTKPSSNYKFSSTVREIVVPHAIQKYVRYILFLASHIF